MRACMVQSAPPVASMTSMERNRWTAILRGAGAPAFLVTDAANLRYLCGAEAEGCLLLITAKRRLLFVSPLDLERLRHAVRRGICVRPLRQVAKVMERVRRCACEAEHVSLARMGRWKRSFKNTKFVHVSGLLEEMRRVKEPEEIRWFRRAQRITRMLLTRAERALTAPMSERELAWKLAVWAKELKADGLAFPPIVGFGAHTSCPHHHPTNRKCRRRDIVQIDVGVKVHGYCSDQSAVFFTGEPTRRQAQVLLAVRQAFRAAKRTVRAGASTHAVDQAARDVLRKHGFHRYFTHALGHGVGLEVHEPPTISTKAKRDVLRAGEIVTVEPGVYIPGEFGIRLEEEVIVR